MLLAPDALEQPRRSALPLEYVGVAGKIEDRHPPMEPLLGAAETERPDTHGRYDLRPHLEALADEIEVDAAVDAAAHCAGDSISTPSIGEPSNTSKSS
jgi:hypothetical protein